MSVALTFKEMAEAMARVGIPPAYRSEGRSVMEFNAGAEVKEWIRVVGKGKKTGWHFYGMYGDVMLMLTARGLLRGGKSVLVLHLFDFYELDGFQLADNLKDIDVVCVRNFTDSRVARVQGPEEYRGRAEMLLQRVFESDRYMVLSGHGAIQEGKGWHNDWVNRLAMAHCEQRCIGKVEKAVS